MDTDSIDLTFSAFSDNENVFVSVDDNQLTMIPALNFSGSANITAEVSDGEFADSKTFVLTIQPINDPPELGFIGPQETMEDTDLTLILTGTDVDNAELYFEASSDTTGVDVIVDGNQLTLSPVLNYYGIANISVTVSDLFYTATETFALTVTSVNDPPTIVLPDVFVFFEDDSLVEDFSPYIGDIDEDSLALTVSGLSLIHI